MGKKPRKVTLKGRNSGKSKALKAALDNPHMQPMRMMHWEASMFDPLLGIWKALSPPKDYGLYLMDSQGNCVGQTTVTLSSSMRFITCKLVALDDRETRAVSQSVIRVPSASE